MGGSVVLAQAHATLWAVQTWLVARESRAKVAGEPSHVGRGCQTCGTGNMPHVAVGKVPKGPALSACPERNSRE